MGGGGGGAWTVCRFKKGLGKKEGGGVFEGGGGEGGYPIAHYQMICNKKDIFKHVLILCANNHHDVTDFKVDGMARNIKDWIPQEWNTALT